MDNLVGFVGEIILPLLVVYWEFQKGASGDIDFFRNRVEMPVCESEPTVATRRAGHAKP